MAIRPDYDIGTVTLVASSANFTTSGSSLQTAAVQAGDAIIAPSGHVLIIASITGQNSGTLFLPCPPAAAGTGLALRIRFQPDGSRYQGAVRNLIDLLSSGNLEAFAALVGAADMVPIFTGPGTLDLADPATFGIQDPNGSLGKLSALTLEANKAITTDASGNAQQSDLGSVGRSLLAAGNALSARSTIGAARPAFRAFYPGNVGLANGEFYLTIPSTSLNVGNIWNGSQMVCNEAGVYRFDCNFVTSGGAANTGTMVASVDVNNDTVGSSAKSKDNWFDPVYASTVARLNVGDIVRFKLSLTGLSGSVEMLANRSYATGVLIG
ncbi:hypothetical protein [Brucella oryzae]|uniref:hypothetical protein n=1 Tax=Brucella oryzae TaxID=335286 RepID=UPI001ABF3EFF|nr:hypothetical protein [Brucella oryzae]